MQDPMGLFIELHGDIQLYDVEGIVCDDINLCDHVKSDNWFCKVGRVHVLILFNKNIERHTAHTIVSWPNPNWLIVFLLKKMTSTHLAKIGMYIEHWTNQNITSSGHGYIVHTYATLVLLFLVYTPYIVIFIWNQTTTMCGETSIIHMQL